MITKNMANARHRLTSDKWNSQGGRNWLVLNPTRNGKLEARKYQNEDGKSNPWAGLHADLVCRIQIQYLVLKLFRSIPETAVQIIWVPRRDAFLLPLKVHSTMALFLFTSLISLHEYKDSGLSLSTKLVLLHNSFQCLSWLISALSGSSSLHVLNIWLDIQASCSPFKTNFHSLHTSTQEWKSHRSSNLVVKKIWDLKILGE